MKLKPWAIVLTVLCILLAFTQLPPLRSASEYVVATINVADGPCTVAVDSSTNRIYVSRTYSHFITVIDGSNNTVIANIDVGQSPTGIYIDQESAIIYVGIYSPTSVIAINATTNTVKYSIPVDYYPLDIAVGTNNKIYVAIRGYNWKIPSYVTIINASTRQITGNIKVEANPQGVAFNPNTNRVYVANRESHTVSVIDGSTDLVVATINVGIRPFYVAVNPITNKIYVTNFGSGSISVIDGFTNLVTAVIPFGDDVEPDGITINPATNRIYVTDNNDWAVYVIDGATNEIVGKATVGAAPMGVAVNPDNNRLYVCNLLSDTVSVLDETKIPPAPPPTDTFLRTNQIVWIGNAAYIITTVSTSTVSAVSFNQTSRELAFNVSGISGITGFCNITIPATLMSGTFSLYKDGTLLTQGTDYTQDYDGTHYVFQIYYSQSTHTLRIVSSQVIPESQSSLTLALFMSSTAIGIAVSASRRKKQTSHSFS